MLEAEIMLEYLVICVFIFQLNARSVIKHLFMPFKDFAFSFHLNIRSIIVYLSAEGN